MQELERLFLIQTTEMVNFTEKQETEQNRILPEVYARNYETEGKEAAIKPH